MRAETLRSPLLVAFLVVGGAVSGGRAADAASPYQVSFEIPTVQNRKQGLDLNDGELLLLLQRGLSSPEYVLSGDSSKTAPSYDVQPTIRWRERSESGYRFDLHLILVNHSQNRVVRDVTFEGLSLEEVGPKVSPFLTGLSGSIQVNCVNYPGSLAFLDGQRLGLVPAHVSDLQLGRYRVLVTYPTEALPESLTVDLGDTNTRVLNFTLQEKPTTLVVSVNGAPATVNLNGKLFNAPYSTLRPGRVHLTIRGIGRGWEYRKSLRLERHKDYALQYNVASRELTGDPMPALGKPVPPAYGGWYVGLGYGYETATNKDLDQFFGHFHTAQLSVGGYWTHLGLDFSGFVGLADGVEQMPEPFNSQLGRLRVAQAGGAAEIRLLAPWGQIGNRPIYPFVGAGGRYVRTGYRFEKDKFHYIDVYYDNQGHMVHMQYVTGYAAAGLAIGKIELVGRYCVVGQDDPWWTTGIQWLFAGHGSRVVE